MTMINELYTNATKSRPLPLSLDGLIEIHTARPMTNGNAKLDQSIGIFDLLAVEDCPQCETCKDDCYALRDQNQYPNCYTKRALNSYRAHHRPEELEALINQQIANQSIEIVRIHSSGDFFSQAYVDMWARIAEANPRVAFYTYTKTTELWNFEAFDALPNINIVHSLLPCGSKNFGSMEEIARLSRKYKAPICPYRTKQWFKARNRTPYEIHCGTNCDLCMRHKHVLFLQH